ncbi:MAG TPA: metal-dependent hydrolase [Gemmatimonadaceae bacterium]|nr:metal-dependent hydrolase [Gemmatimonadaceae bacterium]
MPLWVLIIAAQAPDWANAILLLVTPLSYGELQRWTHSVAAVVCLAAALALLYGIARRSAAGGLLVGAVTLSHVLLDYITGYKPTWIGGPHVGLHLYCHPATDFVLEGAVLLAGWLWYRRSLPRGARWRPVWTMLIVLLTLQLVGDAAVEPGCQAGDEQVRAPGGGGVTVGWASGGRGRRTLSGRRWGATLESSSGAVAKW